MASSVASASPTDILTTLPARPPTPPREAVQEIDVSLKSVVLGRRTQAFDPRLSLQTPPNAQSPNSPTATGSQPSSSRVRKKVEWSAHTDYREPPQYPDGPRTGKSSPCSALSSATFVKPVKSILKPSPSSNPLASSLTTELDGSASSLNIIEMLDSTIKQLAGPDREFKLDAYMMLSRALKASNNLPDRVALQDKMSLFMQFVQRDMTAKLDNGNLDTSLVNHSLTLLATFLHFPAIASTLTTDFGVFIIDHAIRSFEDETMPKDVVRHLMQVVAFQNFSVKVMTSERVGRLVTALHGIEQHMKGKSIVMSRLHIYKRLIKQSRYHMSANLDWLEDMFTDMLSSVKDIRLQAISLGIEAGFALRSEKQLIRKVTDLLQTSNETEIYIDFYIKRLQGMIKEKHSCNLVPQIWSVVILFLRCPLDRWQYYGPWLTLVQSAFNMADYTTKQEANFAWNRYVSLSLADTKVSPKCIGTLCQPLLSQLRRKSSPKQQEEATKLRKVVIGGICNLYYYAFAPGSDRYETDVLWDVAVQPMLSQLISLDGNPDVPGDGIMQAARLLVGLLDVTTPRIWRQDRIVDLPPVKAEELPAIDSKWVRKNCDKVLQLAGAIIKKKFFDLANKDSLIYRLWQALVGSVTAASAKDIKISEDTAKFVGCSFSLLSTVYSSGGTEPESDSPSSKLLSSVTNFIHILIDGLGLLPFTEKRLSMTVPNTFEPIATPSQRPNQADKPRGIVRIPLYHLFIMLTSIPPHCTDDDALACFLKSVFESFLKGRSPKGRLDLAKELLQLLPRNALSPYGPWILAADCARAYVDSRSLLSTGSLPIPETIKGPEYREIVSLIERGLTCHPNLPPSQWVLLFNSIADRITSEFGDAGCSLLVIAPLAKAILDMPDAEAGGPTALAFQATISLFKTAKLPRDKQALEAARSRLWGAPLSLPKMPYFELFDNLYKLGSQCLVYSYNKYLDTDADCRNSDILQLLEAVDSFLVKNLPLFDVTVPDKLQVGLTLWIQDDQNHLHKEDRSSLAKCVTALWDHVCSNLSAAEHINKQHLDQLEPLLAAAFKSTHAAILNTAALTWNMIMKEDEQVKCSSSLLSAISSVQSKIDLVVPGARSGNGGFGAQTSAKTGQQPDSGLEPLSSTSSYLDASAPTANLGSLASTGPLTRKRRLEMTPELQRDKSRKKTSTPRLRHDNSQIHFKPVVSSPLQDESQHLTERQKRVRERQRENAALYSDARSSTPPPSARSMPKQSTEGDASVSGGRVEKSTPKHSSNMFEDLISSTPTPRRGQVFQLDDFNDPPSSPPVPRPYPLLSEIQSRSRAGSAMESWEFSSPPQSPTGPQQAEEEEELPSTTPVQTEPLPKLRRSSKRKSLAVAEASHAAHVADSSKLGDVAVSSARNVKARPTERLSTVPSTPKDGVMTRARKSQETPNSENESSRKPKSSSRRRSSRRAEANSKMGATAADDCVKLDASSGLQDATKHEREHMTPVCGSQAADCRGDVLNTSSNINGCITVHTDSTCPSPEKLDNETVGTPQTDALDRTEVNTSRRKRKRGGKQSDKGNKRRRSVGEAPEPALQSKQPEPRILESCSNKNHQPMEGVETRGTLKKRQQHVFPDESKQTKKVVNRQAQTSKGTGDGGDTDEEVQSQLVIESNAASQQSQPHTEQEMMESVEVTGGSGGNEKDPEGVANVHVNEQNAVDTEAHPGVSNGGKSVAIMETLRSGLDQLRTASLTREKVYEVEDILMDMKRELFEAERRGRGRPRRRKPKGP